MILIPLGVLEAGQKKVIGNDFDSFINNIEEEILRSNKTIWKVVSVKKYINGILSYDIMIM